MAYRDSAGTSISPVSFMAQALKMGEGLGLSRTDLLQALAEFAPLTSESESTSYFTPLSDSDLPDHLQPAAKNWRKLATSLAYTGPVAWKVKAGFTLKDHAPKNGPCYKNFSYLQNWSFSDVPTQEGTVFWIPRIVPGSVKKNVSKQMAHLAELRVRMELPAHHLASFGSVALLAGLILAHYKATGERVPLDRLWVRTDTCYAEGDRLSLGDFVEDGLHCGIWYRDGAARAGLAAFALGVELGSSGT